MSFLGLATSRRCCEPELARGRQDKSTPRLKFWALSFLQEKHPRSLGENAFSTCAHQEPRLYNDLFLRWIPITHNSVGDASCFSVRDHHLPRPRNAAFLILNATSVATWTRTLNPFLRRASYACHDPEQTQSLGRRQGQGDGTAFDRDPDGSPFLWVLQDTYEGETFFRLEMGF
jgi:hypothetical protein